MRSIPSYITKELLTELYVNEGLSTLAIARRINRSHQTVTRYLKRFDIPARPFSTKGLKARLGMTHSEETKAKIRAKALGRRIPLYVRRKMGSPGTRNAGWIDGRTPINRLIRHSSLYRMWRTAVFERDNYTCIQCRKRGGELNADHIKPFAHHPELRFDVANGRTLCVPCHRATDTFGRRTIPQKVTNTISS